MSEKNNEENILTEGKKLSAAQEIMQQFLTRECPEEYHALIYNPVYAENPGGLRFPIAGKFEFGDLFISSSEPYSQFIDQAFYMGHERTEMTEMGRKLMEVMKGGVVVDIPQPMNSQAYLAQYAKEAEAAFYVAVDLKNGPWNKTAMNAPDGSVKTDRKTVMIGWGDDMLHSVAGLGDETVSLFHISGVDDCLPFDVYRSYSEQKKYLRVELYTQKLVQEIVRSLKEKGLLLVGPNMTHPNDARENFFCHFAKKNGMREICVPAISDDPFSRKPQYNLFEKV